MRAFARILTVVYFSLFYKVEIINKDKVPQNGPVLLCANHNGILDMFFIGYKIKRWIHWMAKEELFRNRIVGAIFRTLGAFPVKRGTGDVGSIKKAYKLFEKGHIVGIFPQGTRVNKQNRKEAKIKHGAAMLALNAGVPILPVAVENYGSYRIFGKVKVIFGDPFTLDSEPGRKYSSEELTQISKGIMDKIFMLMED